MYVCFGEESGSDPCTDQVVLAPKSVVTLRQVSHTNLVNTTEKFTIRKLLGKREKCQIFLHRKISRGQALSPLLFNFTFKHNILCMYVAYRIT